MDIRKALGQYDNRYQDCIEDGWSIEDLVINCTNCGKVCRQQMKFCNLLCYTEYYEDRHTECELIK